MRIKFILAFTWFYGWSNLKRGPAYVVSYLSLPFSLLLLVYFLSHGSLLRYGILGGLISVIASNSISMVGDSAFLRLELKIQELLVASDIGPLDYMLGLVLGDMLFSLPGVAIYVFLALYLHLLDLEGWAVTVFSLVMMTLSTSSLALYASSLIRHVRHSWGLATLLSILFTVIPPVFYPASELPLLLRYVMLFSPVTPASLIIQGTHGILLTSSYVLLVAETFLFLTLAVRGMRWVET